jgi:lipopolysaccharide export system protein LptA
MKSRGRPGARCAALALALGASVAGAQPAGRCNLIVDETPTTRISLQKLGGTELYNTYIGGNLNARCEGQDVRLRADSAESYGASNVLYLIGNVRYTETRVRVDANRMTYFRSEERLLMEGGVVAQLQSGTTMRGPQADYYRAVAGLRPRTRLVAPGRPTVTLVESDTARDKAEPTRIVANLITMEGDSLVYATGSVEITRTDMEARGDSAFMDTGTEFARLMRQPRIVGKQRRPFTLEGGVIDLFSRRRQLQRVLSKSSARAISEDLNLASDTIDMRMSGDTVDNAIERVYAWGASRARATSPERDIVADSIDVRMPRQRLSEVYAVRGALAQTLPDSTKIRSTERDWMRGDTIVARFDTTARPRATRAAPAAPTASAPPASGTGATPAPRGRRDATAGAATSGGTATRPAADTATRAAPRSDSSSAPRIRQLVANGHASTWYQIPNEDGPQARPSINYVRGRIVTLAFSDDGIQRVTVVDSAAGVLIEPTAESTAAPAGVRVVPGQRPPSGPPAGARAGSNPPAPVTRPAVRSPASPVRRP